MQEYLPRDSRLTQSISLWVLSTTHTQAGVVFLNDSSTQCLIFVPKIYAHMFPEQFAADMVTSKTNTSSYNSKTSETNK